MHYKFALIAIAILTIIVVYVLQYIGYEPCDLCLKGRYVWYAIIILSPAIIYPKTSIPTLIIIIMSLIANAIFSTYHAGAEWNLWQLKQSCSVVSTELNFENILTPPIPCNQAALRILGLSLAGYNAILSLATATLIAYNLKHER